MKRLYISSLVVLSLLLSACGFQLRGSIAQLDGLPSPLFVSGIDAYSPLHRELLAQLQQAGVSVTDQQAEARSILRLSGQISRHRVFARDAANRATEFELEELLNFSLRDTQQGERISSQQVRVVERLSETVIEGSQAAAELRTDMRRELITRMLTRIRAQL